MWSATSKLRTLSRGSSESEGGLRVKMRSMVNETTVTNRFRRYLQVCSGKVVNELAAMAAAAHFSPPLSG